MDFRILDPLLAARSDGSDLALIGWGVAVDRRSCPEKTQKALAVKGGGPQLPEGFLVLGRAIAPMALQAVARKKNRQPFEQRIPFHLGQHTRRGDGGATAVTADQGALGSAPAPQGEGPIHEQHPWWRRQTVQGPQHRPLGGRPDAPAIDLGRTGLAEGPVHRPLADQGHQLLPAPGGELLAVGEAGAHQRRE
jgi:hypothetical protein